MPDRSNVDVFDIFQKAYRSAAAAGTSQQGYLRCLCQESYTSGAELWEHAKQAHPGHPDIPNLEDEAEAKKHFLHRSYVPDVILLLGCLKPHRHLIIRRQIADDQLM